MSWCWIGTASGAIHVASIALKELSTYAITPSAIGISSPCDVVACTHLHREGGQLAVALSNGYIMLWDGTIKIDSPLPAPLPCLALNRSRDFEAHVSGLQFGKIDS